MPCWAEAKHCLIYLDEIHMPTTRLMASFNLEHIRALAEMVLELHPDPAPRYRLLKEVLRLPENHPELCLARQALEQSQGVIQLQAAQLPDGNWGRFHSQDTKVKSVFRTSEEAIDRAFALGLDQTHPVLSLAKSYIKNVLLDRAHITDWDEKGEAWPLLIRFILAGRLAQIEPDHLLLKDSLDCLVEVTRRAFASGQYQLSEEVEAFLHVAKTRVPKGFIESQHALWIISSQPTPEPLGQQLVEWIWHKPDGIRYLRAPLSNPTPKTIVGWLRSMNILSRFTTWREVSVKLMNDLWQQRNPQGLWDFGSQVRWCMDFPISDNWRQIINRQVDYSTCMLVLYRKFLD